MSDLPTLNTDPPTDDISYRSEVPDVPRWQLVTWDNRWWVIPKALYGLWTQFRDLGPEEYQAQYLQPDWSTFEVESPLSFYFRNPENIDGTTRDLYFLR